ncbi:flagellum-associated coiled-coil domain-containing protein 1-like [Leucoraja erinacea]|uniref:flagellum-associated coiled-coil domain-containing protein 1-like n=1 Tax=Leucoraja erinaceus TaxID=7782 RepID=UPI0024547F78|nr:flagellum-associated coiled-coil domain-containing protein 1-like [Leucoraja erinacea]
MYPMYHKNSIVGPSYPSLTCDLSSPQSSAPCTIRQLCGTCGSQPTPTQHYQQRESVVIAPGYTLSRTKSNISVSLCDEFFNRPKPVRTIVPRAESEKDTEQLIRDLQQQISQLVHLLEQESHKQMTLEKKFQNENRETKLLLQKKHEEDMSEIAAIHALEITVIKEKYEEAMVEYKMEAEKQYAELKGQFDDAQAAFMSYKESIIEEMNEHWAQREAEMNKKNDLDRKKDLDAQANELTDICNTEKKIMEDQFQEQIAALLEEHRTKMDVAANKYNAMTGVIEELSKSKHEIELLQEELEKTTKELQYQIESLYNITSQLQMTEAKLSEFEGLYKTNIGSLQKKYVASIEALESQNIDLKQLFALKAEELCVLKAKMDDLERQKHLKMKEKLLSSLEDRSKVSASNTEGALQPEPPPVPQTDGSKPQG